MLEEAAFIPEITYNDLIFPLLATNETSMLAISTAKGQNNAFTKLMQKKDNFDAPLFKNINISMVCDECKETEHPEECTHNRHYLPPWKSKESQRLVSNAMSHDGEFIFGFLGLSTGADNGIWDRKSIHALRDKRSVGGDMARVGKAYEFDMPRVVFVTIDPAPGSSKTAIMLSCFDNNNARIVVLAMSMMHTRNQSDKKFFITRFLHNVAKAYPRLKEPNKLMVVMVEKNMGSSPVEDFRTYISENTKKHL